MKEVAGIRPNGRSSLVCQGGSPLEQVVQTLGDDAQRSVHYRELTERRNRIEPVVNAFEKRRERCPDFVETPLNGLPISVKDQVAVAGWGRSFGLERRSSKPDETSASLVSRLEDLGAVVTGKTALPPNAMDFQTGNLRRGPTRNPHDPRFTVGGSTGGGAAAVASGMSLLDVGADLAGSLRIPAAWCSACSYLPTEGFWPNDGLLRGEQHLSHFARIGLTARSAKDLAYVWSVLEDATVAPLDETSLRRIGVWSPLPDASCDEGTAKTWRALPQRLRAARFDPQPDIMDDLLGGNVRQLGGEMIGHMTGALLPWWIRWILRRDRSAAETSPGFIAHVHLGYRRDRVRHQENLTRLHNLRDTAAHEWAAYDALLLPVTAISAFKHLKPVRDWNGVRTYDHVFSTKAGPLGYFDAMTHFTLPVTVLGWPVVTVPIGKDDNGLPIGAQLVGKPFGDGLLLALAGKVQARLG